MLVKSLVLGFALVVTFGASTQSPAQEQESRRVKIKVNPQYPELARRLNLQGTVRVQVTVSPDGSVKNVKGMGGNPVLLDALVSAVRKWKYEPADKESVVEVKFEFLGSN